MGWVTPTICRRLSRNQCFQLRDSSGELLKIITLGPSPRDPVEATTRTLDDSNVGPGLSTVLMNIPWTSERSLTQPDVSAIGLVHGAGKILKGHFSIASN